MSRGVGTVSFWMILAMLGFWSTAKGEEIGPREREVDGVIYHVLRTSSDRVMIVWQDENGAALGTFPKAARYLRGRGYAVRTLMNGGIFEPGGIPSGLMIQDGRELRPINRRDGSGNFFLKPNGVLIIGEKGGAIVPTDQFPLPEMTIHYAVQSGPLLLSRGTTHPRFNSNSKSRLHRNGVGITADNELVFAMTDFNNEKFPNLYEFAQLFRTLECLDALFLDGDLSLMRSGDEIDKRTSFFGSFIAVIEK